MAPTMVLAPGAASAATTQSTPEGDPSTSHVTSAAIHTRPATGLLQLSWLPLCDGGGRPNTAKPAKAVTPNKPKAGERHRKTRQMQRPMKHVTPTSASVSRVLRPPLWHTHAASSAHAACIPSATDQRWSAETGVHVSPWPV